MHDVPYVNAKKGVGTGSHISSLTMAEDVTCRPDTHVVHFDGEFPCYADGRAISQIAHQTAQFDLGHGVSAKHRFSSKPEGGYADYFHKMTTYAGILSGPAAHFGLLPTPARFECRR
jgi:hypothetical protein